MFRHHLRTALRSLYRDRSHALLGGLSLSIAIAACVLIALFVRDELSYDRALPNAEDVSILGKETTFDGEVDRSSFTPFLLAGALLQGAPEIEAATVTFGGGATVGIDRGRQPEAEVQGIFGDSLFFDVFAYPFLAGDAETALDGPDGAVLTRSAAERLFGSPTPLGETFRVMMRGDTMQYAVRGVIADREGPSNLAYEAVFSFAGWRAYNPDLGTGWGTSMFQTFARTAPNTAPGALGRSLARISEASDRDRYFQIPIREYRLSEMTVTDGFGGDSTYVRVFTAVALLILLLGAVNYVNLATARGARRASEVGVRKALGSGRGDLIRQFLTESVVLAVVSAGVGVLLAAFLLPLFNETFVKDLTLGSLDVPFFIALALGSVCLGIISGVYPALYLSRFEPDHVLRASAPSREQGGAFLARTWMRRVLITFQFGTAVLLLIGTASVARQLDYATSSSLGFEPENVVAIPMMDEALFRQPDVVKAAFLQSPHVEAVAGAQNYPTGYRSGYNGMPDPDQPERELSWKSASGDEDYARVLGLKVVAGRWPRADRAGDLTQGIVVNESFVDGMGWPSAESAIGRELARGHGVIVGVVQDFHFDTFREPVGAVMVTPDRVDPWEDTTGPAYAQALVRFAPGRAAEGLADIRAAYAKLAPGADFDPIFLDTAVADMYADEARLVHTFGAFALIAIVIACLGLIGLAMVSAQQRTKEIGVRRVLGATVPQIVSLLSLEYVVLALVGAAFAVPLAVIGAQRWLETFVYRTTLGAGTVALTVLAALALATVTVAVLGTRAATADPMRALRTE